MSSESRFLFVIPDDSRSAAFGDGRLVVQRSSEVSFTTGKLETVTPPFHQDQIAQLMNMSYEIEWRDGAYQLWFQLYYQVNQLLAQLSEDEPFVVGVASTATDESVVAMSSDHRLLRPDKSDFNEFELTMAELLKEKILADRFEGAAYLYSRSLLAEIIQKLKVLKHLDQIIVDGETINYSQNERGARFFSLQEKLPDGYWYEFTFTKDAEANVYSSVFRTRFEIEGDVHEYVLLHGTTAEKDFDSFAIISGQAKHLLPLNSFAELVSRMNGASMSHDLVFELLVMMASQMRHLTKKIVLPT